MGVAGLSSLRRLEMVTPRARAIVPSVETGGAFCDFSTLDKYPLVKPVSMARLSSVILFLFRNDLILFPMLASIMAGCCFISGYNIIFIYSFIYWIKYLAITIAIIRI
jgi:hypothetical protein